MEASWGRDQDLSCGCEWYNNSIIWCLPWRIMIPYLEYRYTISKLVCLVTHDAKYQLSLSFIKYQTMVFSGFKQTCQVQPCRKTATGSNLLHDKNVSWYLHNHFSEWIDFYFGLQWRILILFSLLSCAMSCQHSDLSSPVLLSLTMWRQAINT